MSEAGKRSVRVTILGQPYTLLAQGDPREVEHLAHSVDVVLHEIARKVPSADSTKIAVLGCLHLADRLNDVEKSLNALRDRIERKTEELGLLLDQAMEP